MPTNIQRRLAAIFPNQHIDRIRQSLIAAEIFRDRYGGQLPRHLFDLVEIIRLSGPHPTHYLTPEGQITSVRYSPARTQRRKPPRKGDEYAIRHPVGRPVCNLFIFHVLCLKYEHKPPLAKLSADGEYNVAWTPCQAYLPRYGEVCYLDLIRQFSLGLPILSEALAARRVLNALRAPKPEASPTSPTLPALQTP